MKLHQHLHVHSPPVVMLWLTLYFSQLTSQTTKSDTLVLKKYKGVKKLHSYFLSISFRRYNFFVAATLSKKNRSYISYWCNMFKRKFQNGFSSIDNNHLPNLYFNLSLLSHKNDLSLLIWSHVLFVFFFRFFFNCIAYIKLND